MTITDVLPAELEVVSLPSSSSDRTVNYDAGTRTLTVEYIIDLGGGQTGLPDGDNQSIQVTMRLPLETPVADGQIITNEATATADNAPDVTDSASTEASVPEVIRPVGDKVWTPGSAVAGSGSESTASLKVRNASSGAPSVKSLTIVDTTDATFDAFDVTQLGPVTDWPAGADQVLVGVCTGFPCATWTYGTATSTTGPYTPPGGVALGDITGVSFEFSDSGGADLPYSADFGSVDLGLQLRDDYRSGGEINPDTTIDLENCLTPQATNADDETTSGDDACAPYQIIPDVIVIDPEKSIFPDQDGDYSQDGALVQGYEGGVSMIMTAENTTPFPIGTLTLVEPSQSTASDFDDIDVETGRFTWPDGAETATLSVECRSGGNPADEMWTNPPSSGTVDFTAARLGCDAGVYPDKITMTFVGVDGALNGLIPTGAIAGLDLHGTTTPGTVDFMTNCFDFDGISGDEHTSTAGQDCATVPVETPSGSGDGSKSSAGVGTIVPGQPLTFHLSFANSGNIPLTSVEIWDPSDPVTPPGAHDMFALVRVADMSNDSSYDVTRELYVPGTGWVDWITATDQQKEDATGVRFVMNEPLPVGATLRVSFDVLVRDEVDPNEDPPWVFSNCAVVHYESDGVPVETDEFCSEDVTIVPTPDSASGTLQKTIDPATIDRPTTGLPEQRMVVKHRLSNNGPLYMSRILMTDADADFFDAVTFDGNVHVNKPPGANRAQLDVCTGACGVADWVDGTPTSANSLSIPGGVATADVKGIRVTFSTSSGDYLILPGGTPPTSGNCPNANVCYDAIARETLASNGDPIPDTLSDTSSAEGETVLQTPGETFPIPPVTADVIVQEGQPELRLDKDPESTIGPGDTAPLQLTIENTGTWPVQNPLVVDPIPDGLALDRTIVGGTTARPFTVETLDLPSGYPPLPSPDYAETLDPGDPNRVEKLAWTFENWALPPGGRFRITFQVTLEPGVLAGETITNTAGVTGEVTGSSNPLQCFSGGDHGETTGPPYGQPGSDQLFCTDPTEIQTLAGNNLLQQKWDAGNVSLGWYNSGDDSYVPVGDASCPEYVFNSVSYTRFPCAVLVNPGETIDYLVRTVNNGTNPLSSFVLVDGLPVEGDTGVILDDPRGTQWSNRPVMAAPVQEVSGSTATYDIGYTDTAYTSPAFCTDDLEPSGTCPPGSFTSPYGSANTGFRIEMSSTGATAIQPGEAAEFTFALQAPLTLTTDLELPLAWNSLAVKPTFTNPDTSESTLAATEPREVGVGMLMGEVHVSKTVIGSPSGYTPEPFEMEFECSITPTGGTETVIDSGSFTVADGATVDLPLQPAGAACLVWETDSQGAASNHVGRDNAIRVTVVALTDQPAGVTASITNTYEVGELTIRKAVTGTGADTPVQGGGTLGGGAFAMALDCVFPAGGASLPGYPTTFELSGSESRTFTDLPTNAACTLDETDNHHADVSVSVNGAAPQKPPVTIIVASAGSGGTEVEVTNNYPTNGIRIIKTNTGTGSLWAQGPYTFRVDCTLGSGSNQVNFDPISVQMSPPSLTTTVQPLPVGAVCGVYEIDNGDASGDPPGLIDTVVVPPEGSDLVEVDAENNYPSGRVAVSKALAGAGSEGLDMVEFDIRIRCERDLVSGGTATILDQTVTLKGGNSHQFSEALPMGARCWGSEPGSGGATSITIDHDSQSNAVAITEAASSVSITVTNTFEESDLVVRKRVVSDWGHTGPFTFTVSCTVDGQPVVLHADDAKFTLYADQTRRIGVPTGATCTVSETKHTGADKVTIKDSTGGKDGTVTVATDTRVTFTNTYLNGKLIVRKKVRGQGSGSFVVTMSCTHRGEQVSLPQEDQRFTIKSGQQRLIEVPRGAKCTIIEVKNGGAAKVTIEDTSGRKSDGVVVVDPKATVTITNDFVGSGGNSGGGGSNGGGSNSGGGTNSGSGGGTPAMTGFGYGIAATWAAMLLILLGYSLVRSSRSKARIG
ncbi:MAG: hypothetical protein KDC39_14990 [Actinobacteria bacterium]|nr:hypothetical protein [Actinomycetota bacterium]